MCEELNATIDTEIEEPVFGLVVNCLKLRVRTCPNKESEVLCVLDKGDKVEIIKEKSTHKFYKIVLSSGVEGFCLKDFIKI